MAFNTDSISISGDYLKAGRHLVKITGVMADSSKNGVPFIAITFANEFGEHTERFYMKESSETLEQMYSKNPESVKTTNSYITLKVLKGIVFHVARVDKFAPFTTAEELAKFLHRTLANKPATIKLMDKEYDGKISRVLGFYPNVGGQDDPRITWDPKIDNLPRATGKPAQAATQSTEDTAPAEGLPF